MSWYEATRARLRLLFARRDAESRMHEEMRFHVEMETERIVRETGLAREEARRRALVAFGGVERHKEAMRDGRGLAWLSGMRLDIRLGLRMMAKHPGLTVVGVLGMAVAVAISVVSFGIVAAIFDPAVPLDEGERVVAIHNVDVRHGNEGRRTHLHDLAPWREAVAAVEQLGAYRMTDRNLITHEGRPEPVRVAEMSASGFRVARVPPLLGRYFNDEDERPGAPPVVVIGHSVWQARFAGQPNVVGRTLRLGSTPHLIVGVMPEGFAFPVNNRVWTPLKLHPAEYERGQAPSIDVFGRLAPGATLEDARAQLETVGRRLAAAYPTTHAQLRPRIVPYARAFTDNPELGWVGYLVQLGVTMLLVVIGTNVAILVYARTASRTGEIAVRSALGASRRRIVGQLFAEALVLSLTASALGLAVGWFALRKTDEYFDQHMGEQLPFWMDLGLSTGLVLYTVGLAVLGAVIVGVVPALKATRREVHATLQLSSGRTAMGLGKAWTAMIVAQVAMSVAVLPLAVAGTLLVIKQELAKPAFPPAEWMTASVQLDREGAGVLEAIEGRIGDSASAAAFRARSAALQSELVRRVRAEPGVVAATLASGVPGDDSNVRIELEGTSAGSAAAAGAGATSHESRIVRVEPAFFDAFGVQVLAGRPLRADDAPTAERGGGVVVNRAFVERVLGGGDPLGRRVRYAVTARPDDAEPARPDPWNEIVGVVPNFPNPANPRFPEPRIYRALAPGYMNPVTIAVRVRGGAPVEFAARLREISLALDPMLRLHGVASLDDSMRDRMMELRILVLAVVLVTLSVLLLSAAGIYALISFTITKRRREIGIRAALGAGPRQVIGGVLTRAMWQISLGIAIGLGLAGMADNAMKGGFTGGRGAYLLAVVALLMGVVGCIAAVGPARRALRIPPTEALRAE